MEATLDLHTPGAKDDSDKLKPTLVLLAFAQAIRAAAAAPLPDERWMQKLLSNFGVEALFLAERMADGLAISVYTRALFEVHGAATGVVRVGTFGAGKYSPGGWLLVKDGQARYADAALRHLLAVQDFGMHALDDESGVEHIHHFLWNLFAYEELRLRLCQQDVAGGAP